jgi:hypothetical protein
MHKGNNIASNQQKIIEKFFAQYSPPVNKEVDGGLNLILCDSCNNLDSHFYSFD